MSNALENAWADVIANVTGADAIPALVAVLDRCDALDGIKQRVLAEAAAELQADRARPTDTHTAARWLQQQLEGGEQRVQELKDATARAGIGWRTLERVKRHAGAVAMRHDRAWWWSIATPPSPPARADRGGTLSR